MPKKKATEELVDVIRWGNIQYEPSYKPGWGLGPTDGIFDLISEYPIYNVDFSHPLNIFYRFVEQLHRFQKDLKLEDIFPQFIDDYPHIYLETLILEELLPDVTYFQYRKKIYCYTLEKTPEKIPIEDPFIKLRFLFDPYKLLGLPRYLEP